MQCGKWHHGVMIALLASLMLGSPIHAQQCDDAGGCDAPGCNAGCDSGGGAGCASGCESGGCSACEGATAESPCFCKAGPCDGKACYGYRPFTEASQPDVFYNLYVPNNVGSAAAAYPAPYPTPNLIGHTYYTYQPFMPHEMLYHHHRSYHQYYNGGMGLNRTTVRWGGTPVRTAFKGVGKFFSLPR